MEFLRDHDSTLWTIFKNISQCKSTESSGSAPYDFLKIVALLNNENRIKLKSENQSFKLFQKLFRQYNFTGYKYMLLLKSYVKEKSLSPP